MKYLKEEEIDHFVVLEIASALREGKLVVFPTDTVYGIGTNAYDKEACERIYEVKGRPRCKPLTVLISDISMLGDMVDFIHPVEQMLIDSFWPGPLTIKFLKKYGVFSDVVSAGDEYVRIRFVGDGLIHDLIQIAGVPVVAPSANLSGSVTGTKIANILCELGDKVDYILDCGDVEEDTVSTIVQVENGAISIIREGKISRGELARIASIN